MGKIFIPGQGMRDQTPEEATELASAQAAAQADLLAIRRAGAFKTRDEFADASVEAGLVSEVEAEAWVKGAALPTAIETILAAALSGRALRQARWKALTREQISRTSPEIAAIASSMGLSDSDLDALFGV